MTNLPTLLARGALRNTRGFPLAAGARVRNALSEALGTFNHLNVMAQWLALGLEPACGSPVWSA